MNEGRLSPEDPGQSWSKLLRGAREYQSIAAENRRLLDLAVTAPVYRAARDGHDVDETGDVGEVGRVAGVEGKARGQRCGRDQQVERPAAPRLAADGRHRRIHPSVGPGR